MFREVFFNKWILGGYALVILFGIGCYFWYQHQLAPYKRSSAETAEAARKLEVNIATSENKEEQISNAIVKPKNVPIDDNIDISTIDGEVITTVTVNGRVIPVPEVPKASPFGYGPFPEVPEDFPFCAVWLQTDYYDLPVDEQRSSEILDRVLVKLWSEGIRNFKGAKYDQKNGKVYPSYFDTVYITVADRVLPDGTVLPSIIHQVGRAPIGVDLLNPPPNLKVLDYETSGIDPFQYLDLF